VQAGGVAYNSRYQPPAPCCLRCLCKQQHFLTNASAAPSLPRHLCPALQAGCVPILHMRGFQKGGQLPEALVADITSRHAQA